LIFSEPPGLHGDNDRLWVAEERDELYYDHWDFHRDELYMGNPPFESSSHLWYGLYDSHKGKSLYELDRFDAEGQKQKGETIRYLLCGNPTMQGPHSACGCRVAAVYEDQRALLAYCRTPHGDFTGAWQRQWLSVFRSDDLSEVGLMNLSKDKETNAVLAVGDGRTYILAVELGQTLRVYAVPDRP
jgi:hypothetical protein